MSSVHKEAAESSHDQIKCPRCGAFTKNLPAHIHSETCNP